MSGKCWQLSAALLNDKPWLLTGLSLAKQRALNHLSVIHPSPDQLLVVCIRRYSIPSITRIPSAFLETLKSGWISQKINRLHMQSANNDTKEKIDDRQIDREVGGEARCREGGRTRKRKALFWVSDRFFPDVLIHIWNFACKRQIKNPGWLFEVPASLAIKAPVPRTSHSGVLQFSDSPH